MMAIETLLSFFTGIIWGLLIVVWSDCFERRPAPKIAVCTVGMLVVAFALAAVA